MFFRFVVVIVAFCAIYTSATQQNNLRHEAVPAANVATHTFTNEQMILVHETYNKAIIAKRSEIKKHSLTRSKLQRNSNAEADVEYDTLHVVDHEHKHEHELEQEHRKNLVTEGWTATTRDLPPRISTMGRESFIDTKYYDGYGCQSNKAMFTSGYRIGTCVLNDDTMFFNVFTSYIQRFGIEYQLQTTALQYANKRCMVDSYQGPFYEMPLMLNVCFDFSTSEGQMASMRTQRYSQPTSKFTHPGLISHYYATETTCIKSVDGLERVSKLQLPKHLSNRYSIVKSLSKRIN